MEERVYLCSWARTTAGYSVWVTSRPAWRAEAGTTAAAPAALAEVILWGGGAIHATLEFDPPLPLDDQQARFGEPALVVIGGDDRFEMDRDVDLDRLYQAPFCRSCGCVSGVRSADPLVLTYAPRGDGGFGMLGCAFVQVFTDAFLDLLDADEREPLELRRVQRVRTARGGALRKVFHELLGPAGPPLVGVAGLAVAGWRCIRCDHRQFGYWGPGLPIQDFVARSDLHSPLPTIFTVGVPPDVRLVATAERWRQLVGRKGTRQFNSRRLGVVNDDEVVRRPELPTREEREREFQPR